MKRFYLWSWPPRIYSTLSEHHTPLSDIAIVRLRDQFNLGILMNIETVTRQNGNQLHQLDQLHGFMSEFNFFHGAYTANAKYLTCMAEKLTLKVPYFAKLILNLLNEHIEITKSMSSFHSSINITLGFNSELRLKLTCGGSNLADKEWAALSVVSCDLLDVESLNAQLSIFSELNKWLIGNKNVFKFTDLIENKPLSSEHLNLLNVLKSSSKVAKRKPIEPIERKIKQNKVNYLSLASSAFLSNSLPFELNDSFNDIMNFIEVNKLAVVKDLSNESILVLIKNHAVTLQKDIAY